VLELLEDEAGWRATWIGLRHRRASLGLRCWGWSVTVKAGRAAVRLEGRDGRVVGRACAALRRRLAERRRVEQANRVRDALALPPDPAAGPAEPESIAAVEARVRRLRRAMAAAAR
jgi:hypothetical protein